MHLAGESIQGRWTDAKKRRILASRADGTRLLCEALAAAPNPPRVLVCASAVGFYGDRGDVELTEDSPPGDGFLPDVCRAWEAACDPARDAGVRVVNARIGIVLSPRGGALGSMLPVFKLGAGRADRRRPAVVELGRAGRRAGRPAPRPDGRRGARPR